MEGIVVASTFPFVVFVLVFFFFLFWEKTKTKETIGFFLVLPHPYFKLWIRRMVLLGPRRPMDLFR